LKIDQFLRGSVGASLGVSSLGDSIEIEGDELPLDALE